MVSIDEVWPISTEEIGREVVCLHERADYRVDNRDARIAEKDAEIARLTNALELADASEAAKDAEIRRLNALYEGKPCPGPCPHFASAREAGAREALEKLRTEVVGLRRWDLDWEQMSPCADGTFIQAIEVEDSLRRFLGTRLSVDGGKEEEG
jgi:uncharacterized small protein (DUF1192 family)